MLAGMDVSGDSESGNHKFMAIVIGTDEGVEALARRLGSKPIHMSSARSRDEKNSIVGKTEFDRKNLMGLCLRLEKKQTFSKLREHSKKHRFTNRRKLSRTYHALMWSLLRDRVEQFLQPHNYEVHRLDVQCDSDCRNFVTDCGWRSAKPGPAHALADVLAWGNSHGREPKGTVRLDLSDILYAQMLKRFI